MPSSFHPNKTGYRSMPPSGSKMDQTLESSIESKTKECAYLNETCRESSTAFIPKIRLKQVPVWVCLIANSSPKPTAGVSRRKTANTEASPYRCCCRCKPGKPRDSMPLRLLIADDERLFRQSLRTLSETDRDIAVVAEAADGQEAVVKAKQTQPDMALLDVRMPKMDGIKAAKLISAVAPRTKILMLSIHDDDEKIVSAIRAGARGYILKDTDRADFIEIIRHTHAGKSHSSPYLAHLTLDETWRLDDSSREERERRFLDKYGLLDLELKVPNLLAVDLNYYALSLLTQRTHEPA